jgi:hypothetical protein
MFKVWDTDNRKLALDITITCKGKRTFRVASSDYNKVNSKYSDRTIEVDGKRTIFFSFPVSPRQIIIGVQDLNDRNFTDFDVTIEEKPLTTYNVWLDAETREFLQLALTFSQTCGFENADAKGRLITSKNKDFKIKYFPVIKDYMSGTVLNTPARIGHNTGIIEVSKRNNLIKISLVGIGMMSHSGVAGTVFQIFAKENIKFYQVTTSEISISYTIDKENREKAVNALAKEFNL